MKLKIQLFVAACVCLTLGAVPLIAHHAFAAEFDSQKRVTLTGTVTKVEWTNPHARFYFDAKNDKCVMVNWDFELGSPNNLMRSGWNRNSLKIGDVIIVAGALAKNSPYVGNTQTVTLANGRRLFAGSSEGNAPTNVPNLPASNCP
jgi:hypothetical protein